MNKVEDVALADRVDLGEIDCIIVDNGLFISIGQVLSKTFKSVGYWAPWTSAFPKSNQWVIGYGLEGINRIYDLFDHINNIPEDKIKTTLFIFPDVYFGSLNIHLESLGFPCFGGKMGQEMELLRHKMKEHMKKLGLYVTNYEVIKGTESLREYIKEHPNVYVKINETRGDTETFFAKDYRTIEPVLDELDWKLGAVKYIKEFIVEDAYDDAVETGMDTYCIRGNYPTKSLVGVEIKDLGYIGKFLEYDKIPECITDFNEKISSTMLDFDYRGFFSTEIRVSKDRSPFMLDFCARAGSPPSELYTLMYTNLAEIVYYGALGYVIDPIVEHKFGAEALIHSSWADKNWQEVYFPSKYKDNVKLRNACKINGRYYCAPQHVGLAEIGAVVAVGDTLQEAIDECKKIAEKVTGHYIDIKLDSFDKANEEFEKLSKMGIKIL